MTLQEERLGSSRGWNPDLGGRGMTDCRGGAPLFHFRLPDPESQGTLVRVALDEPEPGTKALDLEIRVAD